MIKNIFIISLLFFTSNKVLCESNSASVNGYKDLPWGMSLNKFLKKEILLPEIEVKGTMISCVYMGGGFIIYARISGHENKTSLLKFRVLSSGYMNVFCFPFEKTGMFKSSFGILYEIQQKSKSGRISTL